MKKSFLITAVVCSLTALSCNNNNASDNSEALLNIAEDIPTVQAFLSDPVPAEDLERILKAGLNAPSAINMQPWHFTAVSNAEEIQNLVELQKSSMRHPGRPNFQVDRSVNFDPEDMPAPPKISTRADLGDSPAVIFISCKPGSDFDAGLACEQMCVMANLLGYGTKIVISVKDMFQGENRGSLYERFQVPEGQEVIAAILLGKIDAEAYDAVSSATPRNPEEQVITVID